MNRREALKASLLPYSFSYKIRNAFVGKECPICGNTMGVDTDFGLRIRIPTIQHNVPISIGGKHEIENISVICRKCNVTIKDSLTGSLNNSDVIDVWSKIK